MEPVDSRCLMEINISLWSFHKTLFYIRIHYTRTFSIFKSEIYIF